MIQISFSHEKSKNEYFSPFKYTFYRMDDEACFLFILKLVRRLLECSKFLCYCVFEPILRLLTIFLPHFDCSNSLDKIFCNLTNLELENTMTPSHPLVDECQIKGLQRLLLYESRSSAQLESFVEMLYQELESLVRDLDKNLMLLETEVQFAAC